VVVTPAVEGIDEDLEGALVVLVGEGGAGRVERAPAALLGDLEDLVGGHVQDLGSRVDAPADQGPAEHLLVSISAEKGLRSR
jgi:hypothetical protein